MCPLAANPVEAPLTRVPIEPSDLNGLEQPSKLMVDKITTMPRDTFRDRLGRVPEDDLVRINRARRQLRAVGARPSVRSRL
ncbi:MAG: type II toxin-antitoxin system PemK/MazF family toxin [Mycobacterium sp.]|nr:type II toxin-antitoxin system PemK/MazF family toxin [Mycobacterium sp.]